MTSTPTGAHAQQRNAWTAAVLLITAPLLVTLCVILWWTPYPVNEAVALFEDAARGPALRYLIPESSYYRPLYHLTLIGIWRHVEPLEARLLWIRLLHITPIVLLVGAFIYRLRPRSWVDAAAASFAVTVLVGSPGFRDNLEIPLSYTIVGMPLALLAWMLLEREQRPWAGPAIFALAVLAIGFKEQGLVIVPLVVVAWWTRAPGAGRALTAGLVAFATAYVVYRLQWRYRWPMFEQSLGLGFGIVEANDATARFGAFPYWMYAYNALCTLANILFAEPTSGLFIITRNLRHGVLQPWEAMHLGSSIGLTGAIAWWGIRSLRADGRGAWSPESRVFLALLAALAASTALSFNYSRDRLGGMAVVFYALAAYYALRAAAEPIAIAPRPRFLAGSLAVTMIICGWSVRSVGTLEWSRRTSAQSQEGWLTQLPQRRLEFADRAVYLGIMESMIPQGTVPQPPRPTRYPPLIRNTLTPP